MREVREGIQHLKAREQVELYLLQNKREIYDQTFTFVPKFVKEHKLDKRYQGHTYDITTQYEIVEIDDLSSHPKKAHRINDGIAEEYIKDYHPEYRFYRLLKEEIVDSKGRLLNPKDVAQYFKEHLF